jgi:nucleolar protein 56
VLGAEKALFRHLRTGAKAPKYGILHEHPLISQAKKPEHGKIARLLADKIAIAAKVDFFKGKFVGNKLKKDIERRLKK